ncbi:hypothetical protein SNE40_019812 [Patella caerulea]|uniref:Uncharacterized protein n=1 Tax=Patella caerulea TaxID=87958 RepID=A0AAN8IXX8_PATCE
MALAGKEGNKKVLFNISESIDAEEDSDLPEAEADQHENTAVKDDASDSSHFSSPEAHNPPKPGMRSVFIRPH